MNTQLELDSPSGSGRLLERSTVWSTSSADRTG